MLLSVALMAQQDNRRQKQLTVIFPTQSLDSLTIISSTLVLLDSLRQPIDSNFYTLQNESITWKRLPTFTRFFATYRVFPINIAKASMLFDTAQIRSSWGKNYIGFREKDRPNANNDVLPDKREGLDYSGALVRGVSIGNNQDPVLNSRFNLTLNGKLSNDIAVSATLMDNNIPIQPDGTTTQLNQFDRIFIQLKRKNTTLTVGDYDMQRPNSYFMNYYKRMQGGMIENRDSIGKGLLTVRIAAAAARGKFNRQQLQVIEGNQGPYRLQGAEGERFIILNAGTEKVFWDGNLLKRGLDEDYVMDYNVGTIYFTRKKLVTKDNRVIVEFEYSDQNYIRSVTIANVEYRREKARFYFNAYSEQDGKNSGNAQTLKANEKEALAAAGDKAETAFANGIDTLAVYNPDRVMYRYIDTLGKRVLQVSSNPNLARYTARFSEVQTGLGSYRLKQTAANGRVYEWVGEGQGNYVPFVKLAAPKQKQLYTLGVDYQYNKLTKFNIEGAMSRYDLNRFSRLDKDDDTGFAGVASVQRTWNLKRNWSLQLNGKTEWTDTYFRALNPYRNPEFLRDWNIGNSTQKLVFEQIHSASFALAKTDTSRFQYDISSFQRAKLYSGLKQGFLIHQLFKNTTFDAEANVLNTNTLTEKTTFVRPKAEISTVLKKLGNTKIGVYGESERNSRTQNDTLTRESFYYNLVKAYAQTPLTKKASFGTQVVQRQDFVSKNNQFSGVTKSIDLSINAQYKLKNSSLSSTFTKRSLAILDTAFTKYKPQQTYLGRLDYNFSLAKDALRSSTGYELGSGQEQKIEYVYSEVRAGQGNGVFMWKDFNKDGVKQQNEFVVSPFIDSARYVRIVLPSNQFVRTNNMLFSQQFTLDLKLKFANDTTLFARFLSKIYIQSNLKNNRRTKAETDFIWQPWAMVQQNALVANSNTMRNIFIFNRLSSLYELQYEQNQLSQQNILVTGYEQRGNADDGFRLKWHITKNIQSNTHISRGRKIAKSEFFNTNNYDIGFRQLESNLEYQQGSSFRVGVQYKYSIAKDTVGEIESALNHDFSIESTWTAPKTTLNVRASYVQVSYMGSVGTPTEFALLNGLKNGRNLLWSFNLDQQLTKVIFLNLSYEGRQTGDIGHIIHTGRMTIRAGF